MASKLPNGLTVNQDGFAVDLALEEITQYEAYRRHYKTDKMTRATADANASRLANNVKIKSRMAEVKAQATNSKIASVIERKEGLTEIFRTKPTVVVKSDKSELEIPPTHTERIKACAELNKMEKIYTDGDKQGDTYNIHNESKVLVLAVDPAEIAKAITEAQRLGINPELLGGE